MYLCSPTDAGHLTTSDLAEAMEAIKELGGVAAVHAENGDVIKENEKRLLARGMVGPEAHLLSRPEETEEEAVTRTLAMARQVNVPLILCGPTSSAAVDIVKKAKDRNGVVVWTEATAAAMHRDGTEYYNGCWDHAAGFVCSPPLRRDSQAKEAITNAVADGVYPMVVSNHKTFSKEVKAAAGKGCFVNIPHGLSGVEERLALVWEKGVAEKRMSQETVVAATSANAAMALGVYPRKGRVASGSDADVVVWNVNNVREVSANAHAQSGDFNCLEGTRLRGAPEFVVCNGKVAVYEYRLNANLEGTGERVMLEARPNKLYDAVEDLDRSDAMIKAADRTNGDNVTAAAGQQQQQQDDFGVTTPRKCPEPPVINKKLGIYQRPMSAHGVRNQQVL